MKHSSDSYFSHIYKSKPYAVNHSYDAEILNYDMLSKFIDIEKNKDKIKSLYIKDIEVIKCTRETYSLFCEILPGSDIKKFLTNIEEKAYKTNKYLLHFLKNSTSLTEIGIHSEAPNKYFIKQFSEAVKVSPSIKVLRFQEFKLSYDILECISYTLLYKNITGLILKNVKLPFSQLEWLADILKSNTSIVTLDLSANKIGDKGAKPLWPALMVNSHIALLNLYLNEIGNEGAAQMKRVLKCNTSITVLGLSHNSINTEGAIDILKSLRFNSTLTDLDLSLNYQVKKLLGKLPGFLRGNTALINLNLIDSIKEKESEITCLYAELPRLNPNLIISLGYVHSLDDNSKKYAPLINKDDKWCEAASICFER